MASPTAESANAALWTCGAALAFSMSSSHSSSAMNGISLKAGDGVAHVQCAPWPPTLVAAAAAGKLGRGRSRRRRSRAGGYPGGR